MELSAQKFHLFNIFSRRAIGFPKQAKCFELIAEHLLRKLFSRWSNQAGKIVCAALPATQPSAVCCVISVSSFDGSLHILIMQEKTDRTVLK